MEENPLPSRKWSSALQRIRLTTAPFPTRPQTVINSTKTRNIPSENETYSNPAFREPKTIQYQHRSKPLDSFTITHRAYDCYFKRRKDAALRFEDTWWKNDQKRHQPKYVSLNERQAAHLDKPAVDVCGVEDIFQARKEARIEQGLEEGAPPAMRPKLKPERLVKSPSPQRVFYWG